MRVTSDNKARVIIRFMRVTPFDSEAVWNVFTPGSEKPMKKVTSLEGNASEFLTLPGIVAG